MCGALSRTGSRSTLRFASIGAVNVAPPCLALEQIQPLGGAKWHAPPPPSPNVLPLRPHPCVGHCSFAKPQIHLIDCSAHGDQTRSLDERERHLEIVASMTCGLKLDTLPQLAATQLRYPLVLHG